jgi:HK97 family phage prohead protease
MNDNEHDIGRGDLGDAVDVKPAGVVEVRNAPLIEVRYPQRIIELIAMPYEQLAVVEHPVGSGRLIREICSRGAYDGVQRRANRVKVNRDHEIARTVGRCLTLHPSRSEGLVAELKIAATPLGDETLALAADGILDASAGFLPFPGTEQWLENRTLRRLTKCWLGHIALTPEPAYEGANMLAMRGAVDRQPSRPATPVPTPNLDQVRLWELEQRFNSYR